MRARNLPFPDGELEQAFELGAIDHKSVRVWLRDPTSFTATVTLRVEGRPDVNRSVALSPRNDWIGIIELKLQEPAPETHFTCICNGVERQGRFAPEPGKPAQLTFGFGSCNRPYTLDRHGQVIHNPASQIYALIQQELLNEHAAFMLLGGDQIYSDELDPISVRASLKQDSENPPPLDELIDTYREIYRGYYGHPGFDALRQHVPTLCIWDDHDIFDNWGSLFKETPLDTAMFQAASQAYLEYQHPRNPGPQRREPPYHYHFQYGDIGFFVLDVRGERNYTESRLLGAAQWDALETFLNSESAQDLKSLFIVSTIPVAHTARWMGRLFSNMAWREAASVRDRWSSKHFLSQRDRLLNLLFNWQTASPRRQVIILSGDIHVASAMTVTQRRGPGVIQQFISSAMTTPVRSIHVVLHHVVTSGVNLWEPDYHFTHRFIASENNYGLVRVEPDADGGHRIELEIRGLDPDAGELKSVGRLQCNPTP